MLTRTFFVAGVFAILGTMVLATPHEPAVNVGDAIQVKLTGELAEQFSERVCPPEYKRLEGVEIEFMGQVEQILPDGRVRIDKSAPIYSQGKLQRLVTLTAVVDANQLTTRAIPSGIATFASPVKAGGGPKPVFATEGRVKMLQLSNLKGVKLRTWTLAEELGE